MESKEKIIEIKYFKKGDHVCGSDFELKDKSVKLNLDFILSLDELTMFILPFSGNKVDYFSMITMSNSDRYYIRKTQYEIINIILTN